MPKSNGFFRNSLDGLATRGLPGVRHSMREYSTFRTTTLPGSKCPLTVPQAKATMHLDFERAEQAGALKSKRAELSIIATPEFARNGRYDAIEERWMYDAAQPVSAKLFAAMRDEAYTIAKSKPPGAIYILGSTAVDTGKTVGKKRIGENRGLAVTTGPKPDLFEYSKLNADPADGWELGFTMKKGTGPTLVRVPDRSGDNRDALLAISICRDYNELLHHSTFPLEADLLISPSAGWPGAGSPPVGDRGIEVLVAEAQDFSWEHSLSVHTGVWRVDREFPLLGKVLQQGYKRVSDANPLGSAMLSMFESIVQKSATLKAMAEKRDVFGRAPFTEAGPFEGARVIVTESRPFPKWKSNAEAGVFAQKVFNESASIITNGRALPPAVLKAEPGRNEPSPIDPYLRDPDDRPRGVDPGGGEEPPPGGEGPGEGPVGA